MRFSRMSLVAYALAVVALCASPAALAQANETDPNRTLPTPPLDGDPAVESPEEAQGGGSVLATLGFLAGAALLSVAVLLLAIYATWRTR